MLILVTDCATVLVWVVLVDHVTLWGCVEGSLQSTSLSPLADYIDSSVTSDYLQQHVVPVSLYKHFWTMDLVTSTHTQSCCFTKRSPTYKLYLFLPALPCILSAQVFLFLPSEAGDMPSGADLVSCHLGHINWTQELWRNFGHWIVLIGAVV